MRIPDEWVIEDYYILDIQDFVVAIIFTREGRAISYCHYKYEVQRVVLAL